MVAVSLSNIRQVGAALMVYGHENRDVPPVVFPPILVTAPPPWITVVIDGSEVNGAWFMNGDKYPLLLKPQLPAGVLRDPRVRAPTGTRADYSISDCFYATPEYWDRATQAGPVQWIPQPMSVVQFPSLKGLMRQNTAYNVPGHEQYFACCVSGVRTSVLWSDLSASTEDQSTLRPGEPNFYHHGNISPIAYWEDGQPIDSTKHGVRGRDR